MFACTHHTCTYMHMRLRARVCPCYVIVLKEYTSCVVEDSTNIHEINTKNAIFEPKIANPTAQPKFKMTVYNK